MTSEQLMEVNKGIEEWGLENVENVILIKSGATNGDVIKAMFGVKEVDMCNTYGVHFPKEGEDYSHYFFKYWWNAPYERRWK